MVRFRRHSSQSHPRRGMLMPMLVFALLVVLAALALVLDRLWLDAAMIEIRTSAETVALAAVRELASDDLLVPGADASSRMQRARRAADFAATQNSVAGRPADVDVSVGGGVRFGRTVFSPAGKQPKFLETENAPSTVVVHLERSRRRGNPIPLFLSGLTHQPEGSVAVSVAATMSNLLLGLKPVNGTLVPALPLGILRRDPAGRREDTWEVQIEQRAGADRFSYDRLSQTVVARADGIPEITLRSMKSPGRAEESNVQILDVGTSFEAGSVLAQLREGLGQDHLARFGDELRFGEDSAEFASLARVTGSIVDSLEHLTGVPRIWLLYEDYQPLNDNGLGVCRATMPVAGRIMSVRALPDDQCELVLQPCVITTRTAVLAQMKPEPEAEPNAYIYKLHLTN